MSVYNEEFQSRTQRTGMLSVALALVTLLQAITMFFSLNELIDGGGADSVAIPIGAALVIGVAFWIAWHWLTRVGPLAHAPMTRTLFCGLAGLLTLVAIGTTSWFVATAIGGSGALRSHMNDYVRKANVQLNILSANAAKEQMLVGTILEIAASWRGVAKAERDHGTYTGQKGAGPQADLYDRAADDYDKLQGSVNARFAEFKREKARAEKILADMTYDASKEGQAKFAKTTAQLNQQFALMDSISALPLINQAGIIEFEIKNGELRSKASAQTKRLLDEAEAIKDSRIPYEPVTYVVITKAAATYEHAGSALTAWIVGVSFDVLPLILFLALMLAYSEARTPYQPLPAFIRVGGRELDTPGPRIVKAAE